MRLPQPHDRYRGQGRRECQCWQGDCYVDYRRYQTRHPRATQVQPTYECGFLRLLMISQYSCDNQSGLNKNQRSESMGDSSLQPTKYECSRNV